MGIAQKVVVSVFLQDRNRLLEQLIGIQIVASPFIVAGQLIRNHGTVIVIFFGYSRFNFLKHQDATVRRGVQLCGAYSPQCRTSFHHRTAPGCHLLQFRNVGDGFRGMLAVEFIIEHPCSNGIEMSVHRFEMISGCTFISSRSETARHENHSHYDISNIHYVHNSWIILTRKISKKS